jgi:hypothetical protein
MAAPDIPVEQRPWRQQRGLDEAEFKDECRGWDVNELVFSAAMWGTYQVGTVPLAVVPLPRVGSSGCT